MEVPATSPPFALYRELSIIMGKSSPLRAIQIRNDYRCSIEMNQGGKYCVRIRVQYPRHAWTLRVYFLASSFDRSMKKLEESLRFLQRNEEKLWFWGVDRAEDIGFSAEFLKEAGLNLDRRSEFPRKASNLSLEPEHDVPASSWGQSGAALPNRLNSHAPKPLATSLSHPQSASQLLGLSEGALSHGGGTLTEAIPAAVAA